MNELKKLPIRTNPNKFTDLPPLAPVTPQAIAVEATIVLAKEALHCFTDYMKCREGEATERKRIQACLSGVIEKINAQKEAYLKTIELHYDERMHLYDKADAALQHALQNNDMNMVKLSYQYILGIYNGGESTLDKSMQYLDGQNDSVFLK